MASASAAPFSASGTDRSSIRRRGKSDAVPRNVGSRSTRSAPRTTPSYSSRRLDSTGSRALLQSSVFGLTFFFHRVHLLLRRSRQQREAFDGACTLIVSKSGNERLDALGIENRGGVPYTDASRCESHVHAPPIRCVLQPHDIAAAF